MDLRCHSCGQALGTIAQDVRLVIVFDPSEVGHVLPSHQKEIRKRCPSCEWVNVFKPISALASRKIQTKPLRDPIGLK